MTRSFRCLHGQSVSVPPRRTRALSPHARTLAARALSRRRQGLASRAAYRSALCHCGTR